MSGGPNFRFKAFLSLIFHGFWPVLSASNCWPTPRGAASRGDPPPDLGEQTAAILKKLGFASAEK